MWSWKNLLLGFAITQASLLAGCSWSQGNYRGMTDSALLEYRELLRAKLNYESCYHTLGASTVYGPPYESPWPMNCYEFAYDASDPYFPWRADAERKGFARRLAEVDEELRRRGIRGRSE